MRLQRSAVRDVLSLLLVVTLLLGCDLLATADSVGAEKMREEERIRLKETEARQELEPSSDQTLASGDVLSVRVDYGTSGATQCQVRIDNERNDWYDEVEFIAHAGTLGSSEKMYDDYTFGSTNFNLQVENPYNVPQYTAEAVKGEYVVTVTASTGYFQSTKITWDGQRFSPDLLAFSLD